MTGGFLFSGIGGFELAAQMAGITPLWSNEIDPWCCKVLRKNFKHRIIEDDIRNINASDLDTVDILAGGFPCQPFSKAGAGRGIEDPRFLWPEMFRVCKVKRPGWIVIENVPGIKRVVIDLVCSSLEGEGYETQSVIIPASALGAWHRRERVWIIANLSDDGRAGDNGKTKEGSDHFQVITRKSEDRELTNVGIQGLERPSGEDVFRQFCTTGYWATHWTEVVPQFCRDNDGVPDRVDRIKSLGNSIVPQVAFEIFKAIERIN